MCTAKWAPTGDEEFKNTSDLEMWIRIARRYHIGVLEDHLLRYRRGHGSSSERYHHVRTEPFRVFQIIDAELRGLGRTVATPEAVTAYEAHRNVDAVLRAVNHYILGDLAAARGVLHQVRLQALAASGAIQRGRMIALALALRVLTRLPRSTARGTAVRAPLAPRSARRASRLMCGVVGVISARPVDREIVAKMRDRLIHRGPDSAGLWQSADDRVCLGHRRLVIVDPSPDANQPFVSGDGNFVAVFNGEIYNFRSLRRELERAGVSFRTRSDTEVLVEAYAAWGTECLDRLSGMFAFAIWDRARARLICARDRAGEKPLYYAVVDGSFIFASELKALLAWPRFRREIDYTSVADFLTLGYVPDPKSIWVGTSKLPPGHWLEVDLTSDGPAAKAPSEYWDLQFEPDRSTDDWGPLIRETLEQAAAEMSFADVPVGTFLSGGVDSSAVTAALTNSGSRVRTFTIGFEEEAYDERRWARQVAAQYGTEHTERIVTAEDAETVFRETILWHYDEPLADHSYLPTYYVCREARQPYRRRPDRRRRRRAVRRLR